MVKYLDGVQQVEMIAYPSGNQNVAISGTPTVNANQTASTTGGATINYTISAASNNAKVVKSSAGQVYSVVACNDGAAKCFVKLYNKTTTPTVGTDAPVMTFLVPPGASIDIQLPVGISFSSGIGLAITGGIATADNTAVALNQVAVSVHYK